MAPVTRIQATQYTHLNTHTHAHIHTHTRAHTYFTITIHTHTNKQPPHTHPPPPAYTPSTPTPYNAADNITNNITTNTTNTTINTTNANDIYDTKRTLKSTQHVVRLSLNVVLVTPCQTLSRHLSVQYMRNPTLVFFLWQITF